MSKTKKRTPARGLRTGWQIVHSRNRTTLRIFGINGAKVKQQRVSIHQEDEAYYTTLNQIIDFLFEQAALSGWTWHQFAHQAGLSYQTVQRLGYRITKYPHFRTIFALSRALGIRLEFAKPAQKRKRRVA